MTRVTVGHKHLGTCCLPTVLLRVQVHGDRMQQHYSHNMACSNKSTVEQYPVSYEQSARMMANTSVFHGMTCNNTNDSTLYQYEQSSRLAPVCRLFTHRFHADVNLLFDRHTHDSACACNAHHAYPLPLAVRCVKIVAKSMALALSSFKPLYFSLLYVLHGLLTSHRT